MRKWIWIFDWQGITFSELGVKLNFFNRASSEFYSKFYKELFSRYTGYENLPKSWRQEKFDTALEISKLVEDEQAILSIGCGLGFVEKSLVDINPTLNIDAYDFAETANRWLRKVAGVKSIQDLEGRKKYRFIYCTQLLYALSDKEIIEFSLMVKERLSVGGVFLTVDTSRNMVENGLVVESAEPVKDYLKDLLRPLYHLIFRRKAAQFFGWQRDNSELKKIFVSNGFRVERIFSRAEQSFMILKLASE